MNILLDVMGSDSGPVEIIKGAVDAISEASGFDVTLIGDENTIKNTLAALGCDSNRIHICNATEVITFHDVPTKAIKTKKDSSMVKGFDMLVAEEGDAFISAGSSGALLTGAVLIVKRMAGVERPALGAVIPSRKGDFLLLDAGLNTSCKPEYYAQFAHLGGLYAQAELGVKNPKIGLLNIGTEEEKGSETVKDAYKLLKAQNINFVGNIEGKQIFDGKADVLVSDGFTGNVVLKSVEGTSLYLFKEIKGIIKKNIFTKLAGAVLKKGILDLVKTLDTDVHGGAPILGVNRLVIKSHGNSNAKTIKYVVLRAVKLAELNFIDKLKEEMKNVKIDKSILTEESN